MAQALDANKYYSQYCRLSSDGEKQWCRQYVDQCVGQYDDGKKSFTESTYTIAAAGGQSESELDFYECVQLASTFASYGKPSGSAQTRPNDRGAILKEVSPPASSKHKGTPVDPDKFSCGELVGPMMIPDHFISERNDGERCSFSKLDGEGKSVRIAEWRGEGSSCRALKSFDKSIEEIVDKYKNKICEKTREFMRRAGETHEGDESLCTFSYNAIVVTGWNKYVCEPFVESVKYEKERDDAVRAVLRKKVDYVKSHLKKEYPENF